MTPLDLQRLAVRVQTLQRTDTHGWMSGDDMEFKNRLPSGRDPRKLPVPQTLWEMSERGESPNPSDYRLWMATLMHLEDLIRRNDPRNPRRIVHDMVRGRRLF